MQTVIRTYDPLAQLKDLRDTLRTIKYHVIRIRQIQASVQRFSAYKDAIEEIEKYHTDNPVRIDKALESSPREVQQEVLPFGIGILKFFGVTNQKIQIKLNGP